MTKEACAASAVVLAAGLFRQNQSANAILLTYSFLMYIRCYGEKEKINYRTRERNNSVTGQGS